MRNKRGQLTLFVIIATVIIVLGLLTYFLWPKINSLFMNQESASRFLASQAEPLRQNVYDCIQESSLKAFKTIGLQAGYYDATGINSLYFGGTDFLVVMFKDSQKQRINKLPSISQIESQYKLFIEAEGNQTINKCLGNLASFKRKMDIELGEREITPLVYDDVVVLSVDWPMKISKSTTGGKVSQNINQKQVMMLIPLGNLWQTANTIVDCETQVDCRYEGVKWDQDNWNNPFRLQYISKEARSINKDQIVFMLESIPYRPGEQPFKFNFAIDRS
jgi:hypothetical protein